MTAGLVRALSASDYGVLIIALAASGLSTAVNPAIAATTTKFVSEARGREDAPGRTAAGVITASLIAVVLIDVVLLAIAFVLRDQLAQLVFGAASNRSNVGSLLLLAVLAVSLQQVDSVLAAAIRGLERFSHQAVAEICSRLALTAVLVATAWLTGNLQWVLIGQCVICALSGSRVLRSCAHCCPSTGFSRGRRGLSLPPSSVMEPGCGSAPLPGWPT